MGEPFKRFASINSALVHVSGNVVPGLISTSTTKTRGTAPLEVETNTSDREGVREVSLSHGLDNDTFDILMASWRKDTFSNYSPYMSKWFRFASCYRVSPVERLVQVLLAFLTSLVIQGKFFNQSLYRRKRILIND